MTDLQRQVMELALGRIFAGENFMPSLQTAVKDLIVFAEGRAAALDRLEAPPSGSDFNLLLDEILKLKECGGISPDAAADVAYRKAAKDNAIEGEIEVDDDAIVSRGDDSGAYVQCWMWIGDYEANICRTCREPFEEGGDGYDGCCPSCADKICECGRKASYCSTFDGAEEHHDL